MLSRAPGHEPDASHPAHHLPAEGVQAVELLFMRRHLAVERLQVFFRLDGFLDQDIQLLAVLASLAGGFFLLCFQCAYGGADLVEITHTSLLNLQCGEEILTGQREYLEKKSNKNRELSRVIKNLPQPKFSPITLGPLLHEEIGRILGLSLAKGTVHFSIPAQKHAFRNHPNDFHLCLPYLSQAVRYPTYVGQSPMHDGSGFEVVLSVPSDGINVLIAITLQCTEAGVYHVKSVYPIDDNKVSRRLRKGHLVKFC